MPRQAPAGFAFGSRMTVIDPVTRKILSCQRSPEWDRHSDIASQDNWRKLGLLPSEDFPSAGLIESVRNRVGLAYRFDVKGSDGLPISDTGWVESDSLVIAWLRMLRAQMVQASELNVLDINGVGQTISVNERQFNAVDVNVGPILGSGTTALTVDDNALTTIIADGSGAGQLDRNATDVDDESSTGTEARYSITRTFVNNSVGAVAVEEVGLHMANGLGGNIFLTARDLTGTQSIPIGAIATLAWKLFTATAGTEVLFLILRDMSGGQSGRLITDKIAPPFGGTNVTSRLDSTNLEALGVTRVSGSTITDLGILVGTGLTAFDPLDTDLVTRILDGSGSGQLEVQVQVQSDIFTAGANRRFLLTRPFVNFSGGVITINESALSVGEEGFFTAFPGVVNFGVLGARFLPTPFPVPDSSIVVVEWQVQI